MAVRPWVVPQDVKAYTDYADVKARDDAKLKMDIFRAEQVVINYTHNKFESETTIPESVKNAVILLAEHYAHTAAESATVSGKKKSETFDDYSYTLAESSASSLADLGIGSLLDEYVLSAASGNITFRMRKL